jgi:MFS family permease
VIPQSARGKYQAMISAVWGIAAISGPVVGSMIMEFLDWRYIFWINLPIVLLSALLLHIFYRGRVSTVSEGKLAVLPSMYLCVGLLALMAILVHGATLSAMLWVVCVAVGGSAAVLLLQAQRHSADPLIPMDLLRMRIVVLAVASAFVCGAIAMGLTVYVPSFVAVVLKADYLTISSTVGVMTLTWTFSGISIGLLIKSGHYRLLATLAGWIVLGGALGLCYVAKSSTGIELVLISSGVLGVGLGACSVIFTVALQSAVADSVRGSATSLFYLSRMLGQSIGVALCAGVIAGSDTLARAVMNQPSQADSAAPAVSAEVTAMAGSISSEFFDVFALIAVLALVQLVFSLYTPRQATAE